MVVAGLSPFMVVSYKRSARQRQFAEEFPDALDLLVSALRAGISFSAALQIVADESPEPVRSEFAIVVEEQALGMDLREALTNMANRVGSLDLKFFATAVVLQRTAGGNLTEVLENTGRLIRDRFRILGDIKTFTSAGRLTGVILSVLPAACACSCSWWLRITSTRCGTTRRAARSWARRSSSSSSDGSPSGAS